MNARFAIILLLITATLLAWTYIHYQYEDNRQFRLKQLSELQVFVYSEDEAKLTSLSRELLAKVPEIDSLALESGKTAALDLVKEYKLDIEPSTLESYALPSIMTLTFKPEPSSFKARDRVEELLKQAQIPPADIELQAPAWSLVQKELGYLRQRWGATTIFSAILVFMLFVFARLFLLTYQEGKTGGSRESIIENIRQNESRKWQSALLLVVPVVASVLIYQLLVVLKVLHPYVDWIFFLIQFGTLLSASLVALFLDGMGVNNPNPNNPMITVAVPPQSDALDS